MNLFTDANKDGVSSRDQSPRIASARTFSTFDAISPVRPPSAGDLAEDNEIESEFRDSLEVDRSGNRLLGIRSITVKIHEKELLTSSTSSTSGI